MKRWNMFESCFTNDSDQMKDIRSEGHEQDCESGHGRGEKSEGALRRRRNRIRRGLGVLEGRGGHWDRGEGRGAVALVQSGTDVHSVGLVEVARVASDLRQLLGQVTSVDLITVSIAITDKGGVCAGGLPDVVFVLLLIEWGLSVVCQTDDIVGVIWVEDSLCGRVLGVDVSIECFVVTDGPLAGNGEGVLGVVLVDHGSPLVQNVVAADKSLRHVKRQSPGPPVAGCDTIVSREAIAV